MEEKEEEEVKEEEEGKEEEKEVRIVRVRTVGPWMKLGIERVCGGGTAEATGGKDVGERRSWEEDGTKFASRHGTKRGVFSGRDMDRGS